MKRSLAITVPATIDLSLIMRGLIAFAIVLNATTGQSGQIPDWLNIPGRVSLWVFFGISGYFIADGFLSRGHKSLLVGFAHYALRRICRLFPIFWLVSTIALMLLVWRGSPIPFDLTGGISKFLALHWMPDYSLVGPFWTLTIWVQFYLVAPLIAAAIFVCGRFGSAVAIGLWAILVITFGNAIDDRTIFAAMQHFLAGVLVASIRRETEVSRLLDRSLLWPIAILAGLVCLFTASDFYHSDVERFWNFRGALLTDLAIVMFLLAHGSMVRKRISTNWATTALMILGALSYGIYAWHGLLLTYFPVFGGSLASTFLVSLALAYLSFILIERPMVSWSRNQPGLTAHSDAVAVVERKIIATALSIARSVYEVDGKFRQILIPFATVSLVFCTIAAVVFSNQTDQVMHIVGRLFHLLSIVTSAYLVSTLVGIGAAGYVVFTAMLFALDQFTGIRLPYIVFLNVLFLSAATVAFSRDRTLVANSLAIIVIISGAMMFLQVLGVGEWTQYLTTHGIASASPDTPKAPVPTLFVSYLDSTANFLQGRPAGLFHSNQFASLVVLVTLALLMSQHGKRSLLLDSLVCITAVLTMAKVVVLGLLLLAAYFFLFGGRDGKRIAIRFGLISGSALAIYAILFPGLIQIFLFNGQTILASITVRILEFGSSILSWDVKDQQQVVKDVATKFNAPLANKQYFDAQAVSQPPLQRGSGFLALSQFMPIFLSVIAIGFMLLASFAHLRAATLRWFRENITDTSIAIVIVLATFCLAANMLDAQIFWLYAGFAVPVLFMTPKQNQKTP